MRRATVVTLPYSALVGVLLYLDLRARKERLDHATLRADLQGPRPPNQGGLRLVVNRLHLVALVQGVPGFDQEQLAGQQQVGVLL